MVKQIGILTSGGDCAGLNAVIRAVARRAIKTYGWKVKGIRQGTNGLRSKALQVEDLNIVGEDDRLLRLGGTVLGTTNKGDPFAFPLPSGSYVDLSAEILGGVKELDLDALIGVGGDGSLKILRKLSLMGGFNLVAIPKTIDNDLGLTEYSVGFRTAVDIATEALDRLQPTAASHDRVMLLEVMGRDAGHIALEAGIAGGADIILIPEIPYRIEEIAKRITSLKQGGRNFVLIIVAEAVRANAVRQGKKSQAESPLSGYLARQITQITGAETRVTVLGHVQRGAPPGAHDRLLASAFGVHAVDLIAEGKFDRMVAWQNRQVVDVPIEEAIQRYQAVDTKGCLVKTARGLGISFGDDP